jgi:16S rRNA (uracil1498-N3)-methyltransferase
MTTTARFELPDARAAIAGDLVRLDGAEGRHAADVRRLRIGEPIDLTDGLGALVHATVTEVHKGGLVAEVRSVEVEETPSPRFIVVQALAKGGRDEQAVETMTEIGVDEVVGWQAERCIARWTDRTAAKWHDTTRAAAKQARRSWWPTVSGPATTADVAGRLADADLAVVLHEAATESMADLAVPHHGNVVVVVGPEGGMSDRELSQLTAPGGRAVRLGDTVLRASTAGAAALAVLCAATRWRG